MSYPRNNASPERIAVGAVVQISDGAVQSSGVSISVRGQGGASGAGAGTTAYDNGIVQYTPTQAETDYTSFVVVAYKTGCIPASVTVVTSAASVPGKVDVGAISGDATAADNAEAFFDGTGYAGTNNVIPVVSGVTGLTNATIADQVWDEITSGHVGLGSFGKLLEIIEGEANDVNKHVGVYGAALSAIPDPLVTNSGTAQAGASGTITLATSASTIADFYKDQAIVLTGGTGAGQTNRITAYSTGRVATVQTTWVTTPDNTTTYKVLGRVE